MQAASAPAEPFALESQYVKNIEKARAEAADGHNSEDDNGVGEPAEAPAEPAGSADNGGEEHDVVEPQKKKKKTNWDYNNIKTKFIQEQKDAGYTHQKAKELWDQSKEKASYLGSVSVGELKKRRFIGKDETSNPWCKAPDQ